MSREIAIIRHEILEDFRYQNSHSREHIDKRREESPSRIGLQLDDVEQSDHLRVANGGGNENPTEEENGVVSSEGRCESAKEEDDEGE